MLIELAANERAVHGDFFNSKYIYLSVSFSEVLKIILRRHIPCFRIPSSSLD